MSSEFNRQDASHAIESGDSNGVEIPVPNLGNGTQLIMSAHTHGSSDNFRNLKPSDKFDIPSDFDEASEFANAKEDIEDPAFVVVPSGNLVQYFSGGYFEDIDLQLTK